MINILFYWRKKIEKDINSLCLDFNLVVVIIREGQVNIDFCPCLIKRKN